MRKAEFSRIIFIILTIGLVFLGFCSIPENIIANVLESPFIANNDFETFEFSQISDLNENVNSVDINLPSDSWNISDINLNFSNILEIGKELINIEDKNYTGLYNEIYYQNVNNKVQGIGVQIKLNKTETLCGVYIYGGKINQSISKIIKVQIRGSDSINNKPNDTVYMTMDINMSTELGWHLQNFSSPLVLKDGTYYLVLNGSNIVSVNDDKYHWYYNNNDPTNPNLNISRYNQLNVWSNGVSNSPYLYKLIRKYETPIYPENLNMTIEINNEIYNISNGASIGSGYLPQTTINYSPNNDQDTFHIYNNRSAIELRFNVNYTLNANSTFLTPGSVRIMLNETNRWELNPIIIRQSNNHSIKFNYPMSWENISVTKNLIDITSNITIKPIERYLLIPNDTISDAAIWNISAASANVDFNLTVPRIDFNTGQELRFSLDEPHLPGNYTFILIDALSYEAYRFSILNPPVNYIFSYDIPSKAVEGTYFAYIFFFNGTDAGVQYQQFNITAIMPENNGNPLGLIIMLIIIIGVAVGLPSYLAIKKLTVIKRGKLEAILNKCNDVLNLQYIIVIEIKSGIDIFSRSFAEKKLDTTLISGFLHAIRSFGTEVSEAAKESRTVKLEYKDSVMLMTEFVNLRLITILKEQPSPNFLYSIEDLAYDTFKIYGDSIDKFSGNVKQFRGIDDLIEKHLPISFISPLRIDLSRNVKLNKAEKQMVDKAMKFMKESNLNYFYSIYLLPENISTPKDYKTILDLLHKGVFTPTTKT